MRALARCLPARLQVLGSDAISVKFAYKPSSVQLVGSAKVLDSKVDPEYLDTKSRPAVAQTFRQASSGETFTAVLAHLKSRSSDCADVGDADAGQGAGNCDGTRTRAAGALRRWLASDPTGSGDPDFLLLGDLNAYPLERPIRTFTAPLGPAEYGPAYVNLVARHDPGGGDAAYTYVFKGYSGTLDYALASQSLAAQATGAGVWHLNADEAPVLDYNSEDKSAEQVEAYYSAGEHRKGPRTGCAQRRQGLLWQRRLVLDSRSFSASRERVCWLRPLWRCHPGS